MMMTPASAVKAVTGEAFKEKRWQKTFIVMEYADRGSLQEAVDRGWLMKDRSSVELGPNMTAVLATALEVAAAIRFLHSSSVIHGDLSGWNVMLVSNGASASVGGRSFCAKVADFGLARTLERDAEILTKNYGTLTHMPPETLTQGLISQATDVYSFGILMWQMFTGSRPWSGLTHAQIIMQVGNQGRRLKWPASTPGRYRELAEACTHPEAANRPKFDAIVASLEKMQENVQELESSTLVGEWD
jgi:serine/threonine protein kinase